MMTESRVLKIEPFPVDSQQYTPTANFNSSRAFCTEVENDFAEVHESYNILDKYIDNLSSKLGYADWKQSNVLSYNYEPLAGIIKKCHEDKAEYLKKINQEIEVNNKLYNPEMIAAQMVSFKEFSFKLQTKLAELKAKINAAVMQRDLMKAQAQQCKSTLKRLMQESKSSYASLLVSRGIQTERDIKDALRKKSQSLRIFPKKPLSMLITASGQNTTRYGTTTPLKPAFAKPSSKFLWEQCLQTILRVMKNKNTSQDIQSGIFLDMVSKQRSKSVTILKRVKPDAKKTSLIYDILMTTYTQKKKKHELEFRIEWETFQHFNWRQVMGVLMLREGGIEALRSISKDWV